MILDTCILVDLSRQNPKALNFLEGLQVTPSVSAVTVTEIFSGTRSAREDQLFEQLFQAWQVFDVDRETGRLAARFLKKFRPSHGLDIIDAIIAATAKIHDHQLATLNLKHFPMFAGLARPY